MVTGAIPATDPVLALRDLIGTQLGPSSWTTIDQGRIDAFAEATDDRQWIHVDTERAARESAYGQTIAHGFLTLSLIPSVLAEILQVDGFTRGINYGCERVRFPAPLPTGRRIRGTAIIDSVAEIDGGVHFAVTVTMTADGVDKPACVATVALRRYT